jgi:hypothetical protein
MGYVYHSHRRQATKERAVSGTSLEGKRVREEDLGTEDEEEDVVVHKSPAPKKHGEISDKITWTPQK